MAQLPLEEQTHEQAHRHSNREIKNSKCEVTFHFAPYWKEGRREERERKIRKS